MIGESIGMEIIKIGDSKKEWFRGIVWGKNGERIKGIGIGREMIVGVKENRGGKYWGLILWWKRGVWRGV